MIVQVVQGTDVVQTQYLYADQVVDQGDFNEGHKESVPIKGGNAAVVERGSSLSRLVGLVVDPADVTFSEVVNDGDGYGRHLLSKDELGPGAFPGGLVPAIYVTDPGAPVRFNYVRPQRSASDDNGAQGPDWGAWFSDEHGSILVRVHLTGGPLDVDVTATPTDASHRSFALGSDPTGAGYTFDWHLPGGGTTAEPTPTYTFPPDSLGGSYPVTVGVEKADGSFGWGSTQLQVGPKPSESPSPSPSPTSPGTGGDGPASSGPTHHPSGSPSADPNPDDNGGHGEPTGAPTLPTGAPTLPASSSGPTSGATSSTSGGGPAPTEPTQTSQPGSTGDSVTGILLTADEGGQDAGSVVADAPPPSEAARPLGDPPFRISTGVLWAVGALLLLLAGAASESARVRGRVRGWWHRRWSKMSA